MKKLITLLFLFTSTVVSAGTLVINSNQSGESGKASFDAYVDAFRAAHPEVTVVVNEFEHEAYKTAIRNFLTAEAPDVAIWFAGNRMKFFVDQNLFQDVSDVWADAGLNDSMASTKGSLTVDGKQYGVPWGYYQWGVYYRKDLFDNLGLNVPKNWEEFKWVCAMLKKNDITPITIGTKYLWTAGGWFDYLNLRINGYQFHMDLTAGKVSYEDPRLDATFAAWRELIDPGYFLEDHASFSWQDAQAPQINGEAAMYLIGNFYVPTLESAGVVDKMDFFQFPTIVEELSNLINAGTYILEPEVINMIPANQKISIEKDIYPEIVGNGLYGMPFEGYFIDAGTPQSYLEANFKLLEPNKECENKKIKDNVQIHESSKIIDSIIGPKVIIGPNTIIEKCVISESVILADSKIYGATISTSIIGPDISLNQDIDNTLIAPEGEKVF